MDASADDRVRTMSDRRGRPALGRQSRGKRARGDDATLDDASYCNQGTVERQDARWRRIRMTDELAETARCFGRRLRARRGDDSRPRPGVRVSRRDELDQQQDAAEHSIETARAPSHGTSVSSDADSAHSLPPRTVSSANSNREGSQRTTVARRLVGSSSPPRRVESRETGRRSTNPRNIAFVRRGGVHSPLRAKRSVPLHAGRLPATQEVG
jgi:hypothetical protein